MDFEVRRRTGQEGDGVSGRLTSRSIEMAHWMRGSLHIVRAAALRIGGACGLPFWDEGSDESGVGWGTWATKLLSGRVDN